MYKVLITGATGFIGQSLVPKISKRFPNCSFLLLSRDSEKVRNLFSSLGVHNLDYCSSDNWEFIIDYNPEVIIHLASHNSSNDDIVTISKLIKSNINFGVNLLANLSKTKNLKLFINTGSFSQYKFEKKNQYDCFCDDAYFYSSTKTAFNIFLNYFSRKNNFKIITAIPFSVYGRNKTVKRVIDYILESQSSSQPIGMSLGQQKLDFIHVDDISEFYCRALKAFLSGKEFCSGEKYFLGTGEGTTIKELARLIETISNHKCNIAWGKLPYRYGDIMYSIAPLSLNPNSIEWSPKINLNEGLREYFNT